MPTHDVRLSTPGTGLPTCFLACCARHTPCRAVPAVLRPQAIGELLASLRATAMEARAMRPLPAGTPPKPRSPAAAAGPGPGVGRAASTGTKAA